MAAAPQQETKIRMDPRVPRRNSDYLPVHEKINRALWDYSHGLALKLKNRADKATEAISRVRKSVFFPVHRPALLHLTMGTP